MTIEQLVDKIAASKEILETLPKNNIKNINSYLDKLNELKKEFNNYKEDVLTEIDKRYNKVKGIKKNADLSLIEKEIVNTEGVIYLLNDIETSYEKMDLDKAIYNLRHYYKKNLEVVNENILYCIKKFEEVGIPLEVKDFNYSNYVREYLSTFYGELSDENIDSKRLKNKFEEIYWKCPEIITHIELNIRYLYLKNEKDIDKYFLNQRENLLKNFTVQNLKDRYNDIKRQLTEKTEEDKFTIINQFLSEELNPKDYSCANVSGYYSKFISTEILENADENRQNEININMIKLLNSVKEYKEYLKFKFIIDEVKKIYDEKDKYKNVYNETKKQISAKEGKLLKLNNKVNGKGLFKKPADKLINEQNTLISEIKDLYKELDKNKVYHKIFSNLNDHSTLEDVLYLASSFYNYLFDCMIVNNNEITEDEIKQNISELIEFVRWPYSTIINNIEIKDEKDILLIIKDRYQLLDINIEKEELDEENLDTLIEQINKIKMASYIKKNKINIEEMEYTCEFKKILESI